jgi:glycerol-3-phosphate acyltransferase PlsY
MAFAVAISLGYLLGSIPFGLLLTKAAGGPDLRSIGSGNIGATNVLRTGNKKLAAATVLGDVLKGTAAVLIARYLISPDIALIAGVGALLGHLFPVWLKFKGGKGVATYIGVLLGLAWPFALLFGLVWIGMAALFRYSSLASLTATAITPVALWVKGQPGLAALFLLMTVLVWIMHRANLARLVNGTETRIGQP